MYTETAQVLAYITQKYPKTSITSLMKLCYFIDLVSVKKLGEQMTDFEYKGYIFGPFDSKVYTTVETLVKEGILIPESEYASNDEYICYSYNEEQEDLEFDALKPEKIKIIDEVIKQLNGYGAKALSEIAYKTKPMIKIGAVLGGKEHINKPLDLNAQ